jgi:hypothetical protein
METNLLLTIQDVFQIEGRGAVITGLPASDSAVITRGQPLAIETPAGLRLTTSVRDFELMRNCFSPHLPRPWAISFTDNFSAAQLPRGSKVYAVEASSTC